MFTAAKKPDASATVPTPVFEASGAKSAVRPKRKRRLLKLAIALLFALLIVIVVVQAFLWSDYPRQIAERVATNVTGLRVQIGTLTLRWSGVTTIDDLRVSLPLAEKPLLIVPHIEARHTSLPGVVVALGVDIDSITVDRPDIDLRQSADGRWNIVDAINQLITPSKNAAGGTTRLPNVALNDAVAHVTVADGRSFDVKNIALTGHRDNALAWSFQARLADLAEANGTLSASGRWPHEADVNLKPALFRTIEPLTGTLRTLASARLQWRGERTTTGMAGRLTIPEKTTQLGPIIASGVMAITVENGDVVFTPDGFTVTAPAVPPVTLAGGTATLSGSRLSFAGIRTRIADGTARLDGAGDILGQHGSLAATWEQVAFPAGTVHQGHLSFEIANIWPGRPWVKGNVAILGTIAGDTFETKANIAGEGPRWTDATYVVDVPVLRYSRQSELRLTDVRAVIHNTADTVELTEVRVRQSAAGPATLAARGAFHFAGENAGTGTFTAVGDGFQIAGQQNLGFNINAWADGHAVTLQNAYARIGTEAWANLAGQYIIGQPEPVAMQLDVDTDPNLSLTFSNKLSVAGHATGSMKVGGTLAPVHVTLEGGLASRGLKVGNVLIGDADLRVHGTLLPDRASLQTEHLAVFGGEGWFGADFPYFSDEIHAWTGFEKIDLADIGRAVGAGKITGTAAGQFDVFVPVETPRRLYGIGRLKVDRPAYGTLVAAELLRIPVRIGDGYVSLTPVAVQAKGGTANVGALLDLNATSHLKMKIELKDWLTQLPLAEFSSLTNGTIDLAQLDVSNVAASGLIDVKNKFFAHENPIGSSAVRLKADGRQVRLEQIGGNVLGGEVYGEGAIDFDHLAQGRLDVGVKGLSLDRLAALDPRLTGMQGRLTVAMNSHAAEGDRPLGPVQADLDVKSDRATYKGVEIGDSHVRVFADRDRIALNDEKDSPNTIRVAGGTAYVWGRLGRVPAGADGVARTSAFASVRFDGLDTEQLNKMIDPDGKPVPGRLGGEIVAFGNPSKLSSFGGQGRLNLTDSDLANVGVIAVLYDAMHISLGNTTPAGHGSVDFRLTDGRLDVTGMDYFNRGAYAKGAFTLGNVLLLKDSPVNGYVLGTFRPLKDIKLPFFGTVDAILDALQSSATTLRIDGTMEKDKLKAVPASLKGVSSDLKKILVGDSQAK